MKKDITKEEAEVFFSFVYMVIGGIPCQHGIPDEDKDNIFRDMRHAFFDEELVYNTNDNYPPDNKMLDCRCFPEYDKITISTYIAWAKRKQKEVA